MRARAFGLTDVGRRRETNEDEFLVEPALDLYVVADGMGGHAAGEVASRLAVEALRESLSAPQEDRGGHGPAAVSLQQAVHHANLRICDSVNSHAERRGMGTTVVALLVRDETAIIGHVGDSRAYLLREGTLRRLTSDHSWVNEQLLSGVISADQARSHPLRNVVTRALGGKADLQVEMQVHKIQTGDLLMLCSDGLTTMLADDELAKVVQQAGDDLPKAAKALVAAANGRGGEDNITVLLLKFQE